MATVLAQTIDDVQATGMIPGLHHVRAKGTHNSGATNARLVPMPSGDLETLTLGLYVDAGSTTSMTPVEAELELTGFLKVCVRGQQNEICVDVPQ
jgi:hypothetical protein